MYKYTCIALLLVLLSAPGRSGDSAAGTRNGRKAPAATGATAGAVHDVRQFGATPDGTTIATKAIQTAIDTCSLAGGGTVRLSGGAYLTGTLFLKNGVILQIDEGATLLGSTKLEDYPPKTPAFPTLVTEKEQVTQSIIYAERAERIGIRGKGTIDGQGKNFPFVPKTKPLVNRPFLVRIIECKEVLIEGITLQNSGSWTQSYLGCEELTIRDITIRGHASRNNDGMDIDGCQKARISGVDSSTDDDGLCFKGTSLRPTKDVLVENSRFFSYCNSLKVGTDSQGGFENITIRNMELGQPARTMPPKILGRPEGVSGLSLEVVDGAVLQNMSIDNLRIRGTKAPLYIVLGDRGRHLKDNPRSPPGVLRRVTISNVTAVTASGMGCPIIGLGSHRIEEFTLRNISISFPGGGRTEDTIRNFDEGAGSYPEAIKYAARLPAFGFFFWHVNGLVLENVKVVTRAADERPVLALEDAHAVTIDGRRVDEGTAPAGVAFLGAPQRSP